MGNCRTERPPDPVLYGGRPSGGFVNSAVRVRLNWSDSESDIFSRYLYIENPIECLHGAETKIKGKIRFHVRFR